MSQPDPLIAGILALSERHNLLAAGDSVLVGCSGGADSLALVHALCALAPERGWRVEATYVHHGLRLEADREAELLAARMAAWGVPFRVARVVARPAPGQSPEEAARDARYAALNALARASGATRLALGHHADDQLETVLLRLTKGSALPGLLGIPARREQEEGPCIVRPLLGIPRATIEAYLTRNALDWFEDETNRDAAIPRNRLRHQVSPVLRGLNPSLHRTLSANLAVLGDEDDYLRRQACEALAPLLRHEAPGLIGLEKAGLDALHPALQRRVLAHAYARVQGTHRGMTALRLERIRESEAGVDVGAGLRTEVRHGILLLYRTFEAPAPVMARVGEAIDLAGAHVGLLLKGKDENPPLASPPPGGKGERVGFDAERLPGDLVWRFARPDTDRFVPWGHERARPLSQFLAKQRMPRPVMERQLVLATGDDVLWVVGERRGAEAPITEATRRVVEACRMRQAWFDNAWGDPYHEADL